MTKNTPKPIPSPGNIFRLLAHLLMSGAYLHASNLLHGSLNGLETSIFLLEDIFASLCTVSNKRAPNNSELCAHVHEPSVVGGKFEFCMHERILGLANSNFCTMATVKLTYLNYKGRAEVLRYILAHASVDYEDNRIEPQNWAEAMPGEVQSL